MASLTLLYPPAGPLGVGMFVSGTFAGGSPAAGHRVHALLRRTDHLNTVCRGEQYFSSTAGSWVVRFLTHLDIPCEQGRDLDLELLWYDATPTLVDSQTITGTYVNDSISGLPFYLASFGGYHDPMLDDILAAVRTTFSSF